MTDYTTRNYYHATLKSTIPKIMSAGFIDPAFSTGKRKLAWYVDFAHITWAISHCRFKRGYPVAGIVICKVRCQGRYMHRMYYQGLFCTKMKLAVIETIDAPTFILREEARIFSMQAEIEGGDWYDQLREEG